MAPKKDDAFDAFVLADSLRHEHRHWRPLAAASPQLAELRAVIRDRERVIWNQRDLENQLRAILQAYHPAVLHLFSSLDRDISLAFLRDYPTPEQARRVGPERMKAFTGRHGYSGRTRPEVLVERLRAHLLAAAPGTVAGKELTAVLFAEQLALLNDHVRILNKRVDKLLATHPDAPIFLSFPCMGRSCAAMLLAEMGEDRDRFPTPAALLAETGVAPVTRASGRSRQVRFRYAANKRMRHAVDWWVFNMTREVPWVHDAYEQARAHKQPHHTASEDAATERFGEFQVAWGRKYPAIIKLWSDAWAEFVPFLSFDVEIRKVICSTNAIESVNARIRRAVRARGHFPNEAAALKCIYMALMSLDPTGKGRKRWTMRWKAPLNAFQIAFEGRLTPGNN
jgi:hypothetical protein